MAATTWTPCSTITKNLLIGLTENLLNTHIVLISLTSMGGDWAHKNHLAAYNNVKIELLAQQYGCVYVDLFSALLGPATDTIRAEYTTDGAHLTAAGYEVYSRLLTPVLEQLLADTPE